MVETIAPVVYGTKRGYWGAVALHSLAAALTGAAFGALLSLIGLLARAPWGSGGTIAIAMVGVAYAARELAGLPLPLFDRRRQVPDWWRTFYSPHVAATLYGAGLGIGFLTFLRYGTYVVVSVIAIASGEPLVGALLGGTFGLARGLTAAMSSSAADEEAASAVVTRLEHTATGRRPRLANGVVIVAVVAVAILTACDTPTGDTTPAGSRAEVESEPQTWPGYGKPQRIGRLQDERVSESSGLTASHSQPGVLWTHNDSGGGPYIYALDMSGATLGRWTVRGAQSTDWEAMSMGPGNHIYIGDIGDNEADRDSITLYRFSEPNVRRPGRTTEPAEVFRLHYPDGAHDAEALLVHPISGVVYLVTKNFSGRAVIYRARGLAADTDLVRLRKIALPGALGGVTSGDISPDGRRLVLATYSGALEFVLPDGALKFDRIWNTEPFEIELGNRMQGEGITYDARGTALIATSEGARTPLFMVEMKATD